MKVRTRFAPSPTGYLHIGGVRTALFNWLFARKHGGQFILRIDDTDAQRNNPEALAPILAGFRWLGMTWDEGPEVGGPCPPYFQSEKLARYQEAVTTLLERGLAYFDYAGEDYQAEQKLAEKEKRPFLYSRRWRAQTPEQHAQFQAEGRKKVVRLLMHREGFCAFTDLVRGPMQVAWATEADHIIQRADGTCLYNLANVVDDFDMKITHVIRAEEHLSNTPRQIFIALGLGYTLPEYAHIPFVAEPGSKNKLSKRKIPNYLKNVEFKKVFDHGQAIGQALGLPMTADSFNPVLVEFYEKVGYLPEAILNYLVLLGWSLDDKTEMFTVPDMIANFSLERVNKSPASFDPKKLFAFQERYMNQLTVVDKIARCRPYLQQAGCAARGTKTEQEAKLAGILQAAGGRIKAAGDVLDCRDFFTKDEALSYDAAAFAKRLKQAPETIALVRKFRNVLAQTEDFTTAGLEKTLHTFLTQENAQLGQIIHGLRVALTGKAVGFGVFETLAILGKTSCLARIDRALESMNQSE